MLKRCTQVAPLLCVQEDADDRPAMDEVLRMLSNDNMTSLPEPKQAAYFNVRPGAAAAADAPPSGW
nr:unnamed protein product [Digitaria exilis]